MFKHFSSQTRSARRNRRARQGAADSVRRAIQSAKSAMPESARRAGPWATSAAVNLALFALLFLYGVPRFVADTSEVIQVTVTSFFIDTPPPQKPEGGGGGGGGGAGGESLSEALASFDVQPDTAPATSVAAITSASPQALDLAIPQADMTAPKIDGALIAKTVAAAKAAPIPKQSRNSET